MPKRVREPYYFRCAVCGNVEPIREMGETSLIRAGTRNPRIALQCLLHQEMVCRECDDLEEITNPRHVHAGYQDYGIILDKVQMDWLCQNY